MPTVVRFLCLIFMALALLLGSAPPGAAAPATTPLPPDTAAWRQALARPQLADTARLRLLGLLCGALRDEQAARALSYGVSAAELARRLHQPAARLLNLLNLATAYANLSQGPRALELLHEAEPLATRLHDANALTRALAAQGSIYHVRRDTATALRYYRRALAFSTRPGVLPNTRMRLLGNLGRLYFFRGHYPRALHLDSLALALARRQHDRVAESSYLAVLGTYQTDLGNYPAAERLLNQALAISRAERSLRLQAYHLELLALLYDAQGRPAATDAAAREALTVARRSGSLERVVDAYNLLGETAAARGNYRPAYEWNKRYLALNDSLNNVQLLQTLAAFKNSAAAQEREARIRRLTAQKRAEARRSRELAAFALLLALALVAGVFFYLKLRRSQGALELASAQLRAETQAKDQLYAIVAHDLRGPVTSFSGVAGLIDAYVQRQDHAALHRLAGLVRESAASLSMLLENVLSWAASQAGQLRPRHEALAASTLLDECLSLYRGPAAAAQIAFSATADPALGVQADRNMARTILRNLAGNALKFTPAGGMVALRAAPDPLAPGFVAFSCRDTGPGMPPALLQALRAGTSLPAATGVGTDSSRQGTGLGLAVCLAFARELGGSLLIESHPGAGTTVTLSLPMAA